ncbi:hypothetical protein FIBSPDRAFT_742488 [Athelia psychrophila]|uniref:Zn(2)-C6 fungal-type domain-containing protein n=1 Tax=Athelia psychrophila TaxID=1759441 RepID=A0A166IX55_9AGAM|nr:hypothetical protein FIBSPDRAFT_742488 [Fibularhizoctonia sp. CBS 109695]
MGELGAGDDAGERERPPEKKQALACLFCRERKIACGRPEAGSDDPTCNQCARRHICCEYPKESRRGQHKRTRKRKFGHGSEMAAEGGEGHDVNEGRVMVDTVDFRDGGGGGKALEA